MEFKDRVAMITGAGGRLGRPCALAFAREGARVLMTDLHDANLERAALDVRATGATVAAVAGDISRQDHVERIVGEGSRAIGPVDVLVNFAAYAPTNTVAEVTVEEWDKTFAVNVRGTMLCCKTVSAQMIQRGSGGVIINISSGASTSARIGGAHYCGSKAAVNMMTEVLAIELGPHGIRVNAIAPGLFMDTVLHTTDEAPHPYVRDMLKAIPLGRTGELDEIANAALFLASPRASYVHGEIFYVTGGTHCGRTHMAAARGVGAQQAIDQKR